MHHTHKPSPTPTHRSQPGIFVRQFSQLTWAELQLRDREKEETAQIGCESTAINECVISFVCLHQLWCACAEHIFWEKESILKWNFLFSEFRSRFVFGGKMLNSWCPGMRAPVTASQWLSTEYSEMSLFSISIDCLLVMANRESMNVVRPLAVSEL